MVTKEEIENEGWTPHPDFPETVWRKGKYHLAINKNGELWINKRVTTNTERIYAGKCEGVEDFRKIEELVCYK